MFPSRGRKLTEGTQLLVLIKRSVYVQERPRGIRKCVHFTVAWRFPCWWNHDNFLAIDFPSKTCCPSKTCSKTPNCGKKEVPFLTPLLSGFTEDTVLGFQLGTKWLEAQSREWIEQGSPNSLTSTLALGGALTEDHEWSRIWALNIKTGQVICQNIRVYWNTKRERGNGKNRWREALVISKTEKQNRNKKTPDIDKIKTINAQHNELATALSRKGELERQTAVDRMPLFGAGTNMPI